MIFVQSSGSFQNAEAFLKSITKLDIRSIMASCGQEGVSALARATPAETGLAAHSWDYEVRVANGVYEIAWTNTDIENGFRVVIMLQYGYATGTGGYVHGRDFINPAVKPVFDKIADEVWRAVTSA